MVDKPSSLEDLLTHDDFALSVPTPDHFLPLAYIAGIAEAQESTTEVLIDGCTMGSSP